VSYYETVDGTTKPQQFLFLLIHISTKEQSPMGNSVKRQVLTATVTLSLFFLGSVGVSTAGVFTTLSGDFKGKEWCGIRGGQNPGTADAEKEKLKDPVVIVLELDDLPDLDAVITNGPLSFAMDGYAMRKKTKSSGVEEGFFVMEGVEAAVADPLFNGDLFMQGKYKTAENGAFTEMSGKWFSKSRRDDAGIDPLFDDICVTETNKFGLKGNGVLVP
jgi:hypothetical protein